MILNTEKAELEQTFKKSDLNQDELRLICVDAMSHVYKNKKVGYIFCLFENNWVIWYNIDTKEYEKPQKTSLYSALREEN